MRTKKDKEAEQAWEENQQEQIYQH